MKEVIDNLQIERELLSQGYRYICGVDEVGRGPLCGPVCTCAVIMDLNKIVEGVTDSKKISEKKRERLFDEIKENAVSYSIALMDNHKIDELNILNATKECMKHAILSLDVEPDIVLVDALTLDIPYNQKSIIKGDLYSYSIGAASILAKVTRDRLMVEYDKIYPGYDLASNKGYGTKKHIEAIKQNGITEIHRKSFVKNFIDE